MHKYNKSTIDSLADIFAGWIGGYPENDKEIRTFLDKNHLSGFLDKEDIIGILSGNYFFPTELAPAIYAVIPILIPVSNKSIGILPQEFNKFNHRVLQSSLRSISINISFGTAGRLLHEFSAAKKIEVQKEKKRRSAQKYRENHPQRIAVASKLSWEKQKQQSLAERSAIRAERDARYRKTHKKQLSERVKELRKKNKLENPLAIYAADNRINSRPEKKEIDSKYYLSHKSIINDKAKKNPKTKVYKERYKAKIRFQQKTAAPILSLLQGIINSKQER